jgi:hypothetical protein
VRVVHVQVAEDVSIKLEAELQAVKVRLAQAEGGLRTSEREAARLAELLRQTQGAEVEAWLKQAKSEEGKFAIGCGFGRPTAVWALARGPCQHTTELLAPIL